MKVKICGITNHHDAMNCALYGADAIGFVFYEKSARYISPKKAQEIIKELPPFLMTVGLFVNHDVEQINAIATTSGIQIAQIHFSMPEIEFTKINIPSIPVVRAQNQIQLKQLSSKYMIVDSFVESFGGEGKRVNLEWFNNINCSKIILAGGLTVKNLSSLVGFNFYGVDVSSGVEISKGMKDQKMLRDFIQKAHEIN